MSHFWESYRYFTTKMTAVCPQLPISVRTYDHFTATKITVFRKMITIAYSDYIGQSVASVVLG